MHRKVILIGMMALTLLIAFTVNVSGQPIVVKAQLDKDTYQVGEIITLKVFIENNPGLHGIYFDMSYDGSVLSFQSMSEGPIVTGEKQQKQFLYAASDPATSHTKGNHVIVSYAFKGKDVISTRYGLLCEMRFQVKTAGNPNLQYQFTFNNASVTNGGGRELTDVSWQNSKKFTIGNRVSNAYILLTKPKDMKVIYDDQVEVDAVCSVGPDYFVKYENQTLQSVSDAISVKSADLPTRMVRLTYGFNKINATLYQRVNNQDYVIATDSVRVYKPESLQYIKIVSPKDHQLVNTDMLDVIVSSPNEQVTVNGLAAQFYEKGTDGQKLYRARIWLKKGFNIITAETLGAENVKYEDTIQIYYQKDSSIFSLTKPQVGEYFKPGANTELLIEGEIDSPYRTSNNITDGMPLPNTVTLRVIYKPYNYIDAPKVLVDNRLAEIEEIQAPSDSARSRYRFSNKFKISLAESELGKGELEIIAYKNKEGERWDDEIHRIVYLDDNRLWIDLVQPNVYNHDLLDTKQRIINFNEMVEPQKNNIDIAKDGSITLPPGQLVVTKEKVLNIADIVEDQDGSLYAISNNSATGNLSIYKKELGNMSWKLILTRPQMHGYTLCKTEIGIMVGVSNLYTTQESGLYLLKDNKLINIRFPVTIEHVQFVESRNEIVYIYGNYYNYLYGFNVNTLVEGTDGLKIESQNLIRTNFSNNYSLKQFVLSSDCETAVLRTENNKIIFFNRTEAGYIAAGVVGPEGENGSGLIGQNVIAGEYANGDYNIYLILQNETTAISIMEYKRGLRKYFTSKINLNNWLKQNPDNLNEPDIKLLAAGFRDNKYIFLYHRSGEKGEEYFVKKGQVFFNDFYMEEEMGPYFYPELQGYAISRMFVTSKNQLYLGAGTGLQDNLNAVNFYCLYHKLGIKTGSISFNYVNDDVDGLTGFSFEVDPVWLIKENEQAIEFSFAVKEKAPGAIQTNSSDIPVYQIKGQTITRLLEETENEFYKLYRQYDPFTKREVIHFEFKNIQTDRYLTFGFWLIPYGNTSPEVYNLKVYKKIPARVCAGEDEEIIVPIHGYVYDRTVKDVIIKKQQVPLERDGSFHYNYSHTRSKDEQKRIPIEISCVNSVGATASIQFSLEIMDSQNGLKGIQYKQVPEEPYQEITGSTLVVNKDKLILSGKYYGLEGAVVGYEIFGYEYKNGDETLVPIKRGVFKTERDEAVFLDFVDNTDDLGSGYTAGKFKDEEISLIPGRQQLRIYCENPGGLRKEYQIEDKYLDIDYNMPEGDQKIVFDLSDQHQLSVPIVVDGVPITYQVPLDAFEQIESDANGKRFLFRRSFEVTGEIKSLFNFANLRVKSMTPGLTFENQAVEQTTEVDTGNRFRIKVYLEMTEGATTQNFDLSVVPTVPSLVRLRTGVRFSVTKNYKDTYFIPDFSGIHPENWTAAEHESLRVPIRVKFNRRDLPLPGCKLFLTVNNTKEISGYLEPLTEDYYCLKEGDSQQELTGIKYGKNRIQWTLKYEPIDDSGKKTSQVMSSSISGREDMHDDLFDYNMPVSVKPTQILFNPELTTQYYNETTLSSTLFSIVKDKKTAVTIWLNGTEILKEPGEKETVENIALTGEALREGVNEITIVYTEPMQEAVNKTFKFVYDSKPPEVAISSWILADGNQTVSTIEAIVTEANFARAYLCYESAQTACEPEVNILANNKYLLRWTGLSSKEMVLSGITVKAIDRTNKEGISPSVSLNLQRPGEESSWVPMLMPLYNGEPSLANESNYESKSFPDHTKFAPRNFLPRENIISMIGKDGDYLNRNKINHKITADDGFSGDSFGAAVAIYGKFAVVGAYQDNDKGSNSGSAYIYEKDNNGVWLQRQKLTARQGIASDNFGVKVAIFENIAMIAATGDDERGSNAGAVYVFEQDIDGSWQQRQKLMASDGSTNHQFGCGVAIYGNIALVGSLNRTAYLFTKDSNGFWSQYQRLDVNNGIGDYFAGDQNCNVAISDKRAIVGTTSYYNRPIYEERVEHYHDWLGKNHHRYYTVLVGYDQYYLGGAYVFEQDDNGNWTRRFKADGGRNQYFGASVSISGDVAVVGAYGDGDKGSNAGAAYIYERDSSGGWYQKTKLTSIELNANDCFGYSVSLSGNRAIIGAYGDDDQGNNAGIVYLFERNAGGTWSEIRKISAYGSNTEAKYGFSVSCFDNQAIVGSSGNLGSAYYHQIDVSSQLLIPESKKYLVFKVAKKQSEIEDKSAITDRITFEAVAIKQNAQDPEEAQILDLSNARYLDSDTHVYYIVEIQELKDRFTEICNTYFQLGNTGPGYSIFDRILLRIRYMAPVTSGTLSEVYLTGDSSQQISDVLLYDPQYEASGLHTLHPALNHSLPNVTFNHPGSSENWTLNFWFRPEDEGLSEPNYIGALRKRFLTIYSSDGNQLLSFDYMGNTLWMGSRQVESTIFSKDWNMITLRVSKENLQELELGVNGTNWTKFDNLLPSTVTSLLTPGIKYGFGPLFEAGYDYNTGFYSITGSAYIDKYLSDSELLRLYNLKDNFGNKDCAYHFHSGISDFGSRKTELRPVGTGSDHFTQRENALPNQERSCGSLKASSRLQNVLRVKSSAVGKNHVVFATANSCLFYNLDVESGTDRFTIRPRVKSGRYYFGDKNSSYDLGLDRWYSVSGNVINIDPQTTARLILRINNQEQSWRLNRGRFHFIYDNREHLTPADVKLYIETDGPLTLGTDMSLNQGNYVIANTLGSTAAKTLFPFGLTGTIQFWYKPLNANSDGFVNYGAVLFDSELFKVWTECREGEDAIFFAAIKNQEGRTDTTRTIRTNVKVGDQWQHIQIAYDLTDSEREVIYLYINGKLAGMLENIEFTKFGSLLGQVPDTDNVRIGCDMSENDFAQGYLDEVMLSKTYQKEKYLEQQPAVLTYDQDAKTANLTFDVGLKPDSFCYTLEALDHSFRKEIDHFPVELGNIPAGRYRIAVDLVINGHNYREVIYFNIDNRPKFILKEKTPFIFRGAVKDLQFKFCYDTAYRFGYDTDNLQYIGLAARISYVLNGQAQTQTSYLVQDFQTDPNQWLIGQEDSTSMVSWEVTPSENGFINLLFKNVAASTNVECQFKYFYFRNQFSDAQKFDNLTDTDLKCTVPVAVLQQPIVPEKDEMGDEYKLVINLTDSNGGATDPIFSEVLIEYETVHTTTGKTKIGSVGLNWNGQAELFYDDILQWNGTEPDYGVYNCKLRLKYKGAVYMETGGVQLVWSQKQDKEEIAELHELEISEFSLLNLDQQNPEETKASFYLKYIKNGITTVTSKIRMFVDDRPVPEFDYNKEIFGEHSSWVFNKLRIPKGKFKIQITLESSEYVRSREIEIDNTVDKPEIALTNWVDSLIQYDNVLFSWKGYYHGQFNEKIEYQYNLDNHGWTTPNSEWRSVQFYNLSEGYHLFQVRALYNNMPSEIRQVTFFVDIKKPVFEPSKITVKKVYDTQNVFYAVKLTGATESIHDASLEKVLVNDTEIKCQSDGSFETDLIPINTDGAQEIIITARDKVGNYTDYAIKVDNTITEILYPSPGRTVKYSPLTLHGNINRQINAGMQIYVADMESTAKGDYSGWKKAKINPDRTFFVEDLFVNPGTPERTIMTKLRMACVFDSGKSFEREIDIRANEILRPIEMNLNTHAAEGDDSNTFITISCRANVPKISSWSIDFDGDGVYDLVDLVNNTNSAKAQTHSWEHKYASLGLVNPRVRIITTDGDFFSTAEQLIIHEKIREASFKLLPNAISMAVVRMPDESNRIFILRKQEDQFLVEVYEVRRNDNYIGNKKLYEINLNEFEIANPVKIKALDGDRLFVATNKDGLGSIYQLNANMSGNYSVASVLRLEDEVADFTLQEGTILVSKMNLNTFTRASLTDGIINQNSVTVINPSLINTVPLKEKVGLETDGWDFYVADYYNQRVVQLSPSLKMVDQFGGRGNGEKEFIWPGMVRFHENRLFVSDSGRHDIQVFDRNYNPICTLAYRNDPKYYNYVGPEFFNDIADFEVIGREEGNRLYYYALILSRSSGKLSMIRLPQWEELKVRVRNNKIVFLKDGELYTAKPDGGDLRKVLSSDSLPRIEGTIDYPALAADGQRLAFTSRVRLYNGEPENELEDNIYAYDNLYYVNLENQKITKVDLGTYSGYEIERPIFNSNGSKLVFSAKPPRGKWKIYSYDFVTGMVSKLFEADESARFPYYSPDDRYLVFTSDFGGDEEIEIVNLENPNIRVAVTQNFCRDSLPVWSTVYPSEFENKDLQKLIKSKIAFVSERNTHKGVYCVYLAQETDATLSVYDVKNQQVVGNNPDQAALEVTTPELEGDYPCFTGDGRSLLFEYYDGRQDFLKKLDFETNLNSLITGKPITYQDMELVQGATRPAGMKNMITNFTAINRNGNEVLLSWNRYTENDIFYSVQYKPINSQDCYQNNVLSQSGTVLSGLKMGTDYLVRVFIKENETEMATSYWAKVKLPDVIARPSYSIDPENPYLVRLHAWKPEPQENYKWRFSWVVENTEIQVQNSQDYQYEFGTSGTKEIFLKAYTEGQTATNVSETMKVKIASDLKPVIEHTLAEDSSYIELSAEKSLGNKLNLASAQWTISGPGREPLKATGSKVIIQLDGFKHKINVNLTLQRIAVNNQSDIAEINKVIDLDLKDLKPVITYETIENNKRLVRFSGEYSQGNINWQGVRWTIFANGGVLYSIDGVMTFDYLFPETNQDTVYTVSLIVPRRNDGKTTAVSQVITMTATPIEPKIKYEILELKQGTEVVGAKILFDCTESKGSGIDFSRAQWVVPAASGYGEQAVQVGPTAVYNLFNVSQDTVLRVALTLSRKNSDEAITVTKLVNINKNELPQGKLIVNESIDDSTNGTMLTLDVFKSTGPNIDWERTEWVLDGELRVRGPVVKKEYPASAENNTVSYVCSLYRFGSATPEVFQREMEIKRTAIVPVISAKRLSGNQHRMYELTVLDTPGVNIDWERTEWYIYDGGDRATRLQGSSVAHEFPFLSARMGYPVMVEMFLKGNSYPFIGYKTLEIESDKLMPIMMMEADPKNPNLITFTATNSQGSNINWSQAKWSFGDSKEAQYGPVVSHEYPTTNKPATYKVTLTLSRTNAAGIQTEIKTVTKDLRIGPDRIKAVIKATKYGDYLVLSAEDSEGKGLLLDRCNWLFDGQGDTESLTKVDQGGVIRKQSYTKSQSDSRNNNTSWWNDSGADTRDSHTTIGTLAAFSNFKIPFYTYAGSRKESDSSSSYGETSIPESWESVDYSDYKNEQLNFSSQNSHVGAVCRRYIGGKTKEVVTLFVYRMTAEGGVEGESITIVINPNDDSLTRGAVFGK